VTADPRPRLAAVALPDAPEQLAALGLDPAAPVGTTVLEPGAAGTAYRLADDAPDRIPGTHPNGATGVDHVVVGTPDLDATIARLEAAGLPCRRIREAVEGRRQAFFVLADALIEAVAPLGEAEHLWGLTLVVPDVDALAAQLGPERCGTPKAAVQPGRRIATARGTTTPIAFITPRT
jgi:hypothetical protein